MTVVGKRKNIAVASGLLLLLAFPPIGAWAQRHRRGPEVGGGVGGIRNSGGGDAFPAKSALDAEQAKLETDLASMFEQRAQAASPALEFQIDTHILARWLIQQADKAPAQSSLQACAYLRAVEILNIDNLLSARLTAAPIGADQADGLARLHKLTFKLSDAKDVGKLDDFCKNAAVALIAASGPLPAGMHDLPQMRPQAGPGHPAGPVAPPPAAPTLAKLVDAATHASVSPALHAQLVALADAATNAAKDPNTGEEAATLSAMLDQVMDLVTGLQTNVGVDADQRTKMEQSLTDGVALFADSRMRTAGRRRIESLDQYRHNLDRIRKLNLSPDLSAKFAGAFVFADENPDTGNDVMEAIQKWAALKSAFDNHTSPPGMSSNQTRIIEVLQKDYSTQRDAFLTDAGNLSANPNGAFTITPADLLSHIPKMQHDIDMTQLIERATVAETALLPFHPRPTGGLEHRVNAALSTIADDIRLSPDHMSQREADRQDEAMRFLGDLERLAQTAADVATGSAGIPAAVSQNWAGGKLADFDTKRNDLVTALVSQAASSKSIDSATLDRLDQAKTLIAGLHDAVAVQSAIDQVKSLSHWVDWTIAPADLQAMLGPVRDACAAAVTGFINDDDDAMRNWPGVRQHYAPLMTLVASASAYADQCNALPGDLVGEMAKLATPMDDQPFADERFASLCVGLWSAYNAMPDQADADAMAQALLKMGK